MNIDLNITFAVILGVIAVVTPMLTALINNRHQLKVKRFENQELAKRQALIDFINVVGDCAMYDGKLSSSNMKQFQKSANTLLVFFPNINIEVLDKIQNAILQTNVTIKDKELRPLIIELSKSLKQI